MTRYYCFLQGVLDPSIHLAEFLPSTHEYLLPGSSSYINECSPHWARLTRPLSTTCLLRLIKLYQYVDEDVLHPSTTEERADQPCENKAPAALLDTPKAAFLDTPVDTPENV